MKNPLEKYKELYASDLENVDKTILSVSEGKAGLIGQLLNHMIKSGGKRLRPILLILSSKAFNAPSEKYVKMAACVEMLHTATLFHDDVVDESKLRRGEATANEVWGNSASVLVGDFMLAQAFELMSDVGMMEIINILSKTSSIITHGEIKQLMFKANISTSRENYIDIISSKTAELFAACGRVGAVLGGADDAKKSLMENFGRDLGIAFQIADDVLDYDKSKSKLGKKVGEDFREGKVTLPIIHLYENSDDQYKQFLKDLFSGVETNRSEENLVDVVSRMENAGSLDFSINQAKNYIKTAENALKNSLSEDNEYRESLLEILHFSVNRDF